MSCLEIAFKVWEILKSQPHPLTNEEIDLYKIAETRLKDGLNPYLPTVEENEK